MRREIKTDPGFFWEGCSWWVFAGVGDESAEPCMVVRPHRIPLVILLVLRKCVDVSQTDVLLCGGYNWVSRSEVTCMCNRWTGKR